MSFDNSPLLEQYQTSIVAAVVPAFDDGSPVEVQISALQVCGQLIASGVSKNIKDIIRAFKPMETFLEESDISTQGNGEHRQHHVLLLSLTWPYADAAGGRPRHGQLHRDIRLICSAAWARVYIASATNPPLKPFLDAKRSALLSLWQNVLLEQSPSATLTQDTNSGTDFISPSARQEMEAGPHNCLLLFVVLMARTLVVQNWLLVLNAWSSLADMKTSQPATLIPIHTLLADLLFCLETVVLDDVDTAVKRSTAHTAVASLMNLLKNLGDTSQFTIGEGIQAELFHVTHRLYLANNRYISGELPGLIKQQYCLHGNYSTIPGGSGWITSSLRLLFHLFRRELHHGTSSMAYHKDTHILCANTCNIQNDGSL